jgi:hypothetical protein
MSRIVLILAVLTCGVAFSAVADDPGAAPPAQAAPPPAAPPAAAPPAAPPAETPPAAAKDAPAAAEAPAEKAPCGEEAIAKQLDDAIAAVKASPAYGHAGGHFKKIEVQLSAAKRALKQGCAAYAKPEKKKGGKKK